VSLEASLPAGDRRPGPGARTILVALVALAVAAGLLWLVSLFIGGAAAPGPPARSPFGVGPREAVATGGGGLAGWLLAVQGDFYRRLSGALRAAREDGSALWSLVLLGFAYGAFHAAGPGHGKAVIAGWIVASERALHRGVSLAFAAALLQALVAIGLVLVMSLALGATAQAMTGAANVVEIASFAALALLGLALLPRKARRLAALLDPPSRRAIQAGPACDHYHGPDPASLERQQGFADLAGVVVAAGARPCSGAVILLVFALAQGMLAAGVAAVLAMALGVALTTSAVAALAVLAKGAALRLASGRGRGGLLAGAALETLAAALLATLGAALVAGLWSAGAQA